MTPEKVIELAKQAGFKTSGAVVRTMHSSGAWVGINGELQRFSQLVRNEALEEAAKTLEGSAFTENGIPHRQTQHAGSWQEKSTVGLFVTANAKKLRSLKS